MTLTAISNAMTTYTAGIDLADKPSVAGPAQTSTDAKANTQATPNTVAGSAVKVTVSAEAKAANAIAQAPASEYEKYFPTREGYSSAALAAAIKDPAQETFSAGKSLSDVVDSVRQAFDQRYADMKASGQPFDYNSWQGKDWYALMGDLDRRALNAVSTNQGGQFSKEEQGIARSIMSNQQGWAMGLGGGPSDLIAKASAGQLSDSATRFSLGMAWLDKVGGEEKTSVTWAVQRAGIERNLQNSFVTPSNPYGRSSALLGTTTSDNPLVRLISSAMSTMSQGGDRAWVRGSIDSSDDLLGQGWFKGFEGQLAGALQATRDLYGVST